MSLWTTPGDLKAQVLRDWERGLLLSHLLTGASPFPLQLRLKKPDSRTLAGRFDEVRQWIRHLQEGEGDYRLVWKAINHRQLGRNQVPEQAWIDSPEAAWRLIGKTAEAKRFRQLAEDTLHHFPGLESWLTRYPLRALENADHWSKVLAVLQWFRANPRSGLYLRQLDIEGVDTKFIEQRRGLLGELLDAAQDPQDWPTELKGIQGFNRRYGLLDKPLRIRLRVLDPALEVMGLNDLELPVEQLARLELAHRQVFVTENEINFLAFPAHPGSLVLFGQGYALDRLAEIPWLHDHPLHYWGDLDTHGFAILDRLRAHLPHTRSLLMDRETLHEHQRLWGEEPEDKRCRSSLTRLDAQELRLFEDLLHNRIPGAKGQPACNVRLEQEHVGFSWLNKALEVL